MTKPQLAHCLGWGINPRALLSLWGFSPWKWWKSRLQEKYRLSWALSTHLLDSVQCLILYHHPLQFLPAMPSPQQCKGGPSHLEQAAFILNLMQQSVFLCSPPSCEGTHVSLGLPCLSSHHSSRTSSCYIAFTLWEASAFYFNMKTFCFLHYSFFINSLCWLAWQNTASCVCRKAQWKTGQPKLNVHFTVHHTVETYINIASARLVWQILFKVSMNSNLILPLALVLDNPL